VSIARPSEDLPATPMPERRALPGALFWLPALVLAAGLAAGVLLWARWGLAVAFEAVRAYCL